MKKIVFFGGGNIAQSIILGLVSSDMIKKIFYSLTEIEKTKMSLKNLV